MPYNTPINPWITGADGSRQLNPNYDPETRTMRQPAQQNQSPNFQGNLSPPDLTNFRPFSDATYAEATRVLNPRFEAARSRFDQDMVNRGISSNTKAYDDAFDDFSRAQNDAYSSAQNQALLSGLGAQNQAFGQDFQNRSLTQQGEIAANQLADSQAARETSRLSMLDQLRENQRQFDLNFGENRRVGDRGFGEDQRRFDTSFGEDQRRYNSGFGEDQRRWDLGRGDNLENADFARLMELAGLSMSGAGFNNNAAQQELGNTMPFFGMMPNQGPTGIDVLSPYQINQQGQIASNQAQAQRNNGFWGSVGQLGASALPFMFSSKELKTGGELIDTNKTLEAVLSIPVRAWQYKEDFSTDNEVHVGPWAEDFNKALGLSEKPGIHIADAIGALIGAVQAQAAQIEELKSQIKKAA